MIFDQSSGALSRSFNYHYTSLFTKDLVIVDIEEIDANLLAMLRAFHDEQPCHVGDQCASVEAT